MHAGQIGQLRSQVLSRVVEFVYGDVRSRGSYVCPGQLTVEVVDRSGLRCQLFGGAQILGKPVYPVGGIVNTCGSGFVRRPRTLGCRAMVPG
ncbi:hypothetical protein RDE2_52650 (plasmid) [Rhodococcus sp. RDE2]|nr:hypothetical protein RDE2_52650 [Rhodococcus sp. RDE2]